MVNPLPAFVPDPNVPLTLRQLANFLRKPVKAFFRQRLIVAFEEDQQAHADDECFAVDGLQEYLLILELLATATAEDSPAQEEACVTRSLTRLR